MKVEKKYRIISYSKAKSLMAMFVPLLLLLLLFYVLIPYLSFSLFRNLGVLIISILSIMSYFILPKYVARQIIDITFSNEGLAFEYLPNLFLHVNLKRVVCFKDIATYKYEPSYNFVSFKITLSNGEKVVIHRWFNDDEDQFFSFYTEFERKIKGLNISGHKIEKEKLLMENKKFLIALLVFTVSFLCLSFYSFVSNRGIRLNSYFILIIGPMFWLIFQIWMRLRK